METNRKPEYAEDKPPFKNYVALLALMIIALIVLSALSFTFISKQLPAGEEAEEKIVVKSDDDAGVLTQRFDQSLRESETVIKAMRNIDFSK